MVFNAAVDDVFSSSSLTCCSLLLELYLVGLTFSVLIANPEKLQVLYTVANSIPLVVC